MQKYVNKYTPTYVINVLNPFLGKNGFEAADIYILQDLMTLKANGRNLLGIF